MEWINCNGTSIKGLNCCGNKGWAYGHYRLFGKIWIPGTTYVYKFCTECGKEFDIPVIPWWARWAIKRIGYGA